MDDSHTYRIRTPDRDFKGPRCGGKIFFLQGEATTDDADVAEELARLGYEVTPDSTTRPGSPVAERRHKPQAKKR